MPKINFRLATGFTLIEVLVSMVILALGLLGIAALQGISLKNNQDAYLYSQASALAYEMGDLIKANKVYWSPSNIPYSVPTLVTTAPATQNPCPNCDAKDPCSPDNMAAHDYCYWQQKATTTLLTGATVGITESTGATSSCTGSAPSLCLTISWPRIGTKKSSSSDTTTNTLGFTASYQLEVTP